MTIIKMIEQAQNRYACNYAFTYMNSGIENKVSYKRFWNDICEKECMFWQKGITKSIVALWGDNSYEWIVTCCAAWKVGCNILIIDSTWPIDRVDMVLMDMQCKWVFTDKNCIGKTQEYHMINFEDKNSDSTINVSADKTEIDEEDVAITIYTSGTVSSAKRIVLTHKNITSNVIAVAKRVMLNGIGLLVLPLSHLFGLSSVFLLSIWSGCELVICKHVRYIKKDVLKYNPSYIMLVPMLIRELYDFFGENSGLKIKKIYSGGAPIDKGLILQYKDIGISVINSYGMTECSPAITVGSSGSKGISSVGKPIEGMRVLIHRPDEKGIGEILVKGESVMHGYFKEDNGKYYVDGWFKTGDLGMIDDEGYLYVVGRKKNVIITSNGVNIYPEEIEDKLLKYAEIQEVIVFQQENRIMAEIFPSQLFRNSNKMENILRKIIASVNTELPYHSNINGFFVRKSELSRNRMGKIRRLQGEKDKGTRYL